MDRCQYCGQSRNPQPSQAKCNCLRDKPFGETCPDCRATAGATPLYIYACSQHIDEATALRCFEELQRLGKLGKASDMETRLAKVTARLASATLVLEAIRDYQKDDNVPFSHVEKALAFHDANDVEAPGRFPVLQERQGRPASVAEVEDVVNRKLAEYNSRLVAALDSAVAQARIEAVAEVLRTLSRKMS